MVTSTTRLDPPFRSGLPSETFDAQVPDATDPAVGDADYLALLELERESA